MSREDEQGPYFIGDAELVLMGVAAAMAGRSHALRKGYSQTIPDDATVMRRLLLGIASGLAMPVDDVPNVTLALYSDLDTLNRLKTLADTAESEEDDS